MRLFTGIDSIKFILTVESFWFFKRKPFDESRNGIPIKYMILYGVHKQSMDGRVILKTTCLLSRIKQGPHQLNVPSTYGLTQLGS